MITRYFANFQKIVPNSYTKAQVKFEQNNVNEIHIGNCLEIGVYKDTHTYMDISFLVQILYFNYF